MPPKAGIGRSELETLQYIQEHYPITVRELAEHLAKTKGHTRTTALNTMERLRQKGYLTREKVEGIHQYSPTQLQPQFLRSMVRDFVNQVLGGAVAPFVAYLTQEARVSDEQLEELRQLVDQLDERREEERKSSGTEQEEAP
ncbi:MAG: BlaI/MecI/CopY family transcriptional regulator [Actinomycetota bacterium]